MGEKGAVKGCWEGPQGPGKGHGHSLRENSSCAATVPSISFGLMRRVQSPSASVV